MTTAQGQALAGEVAYDADGAGLTFVKAGGPLEAGTYTVRIKSGSQSVPQLDGNADGTAGDDYVGTIGIGASTALGRVSIGDVSAGPGESIGQLPIQFESTGKVTTIRFSLIYDPSLLVVEGATLGSGLPSGVVLSANLTTPGNARFTVQSVKALPAGVLNLIDLKARVPGTAVLGTVRVLDVADVLLNASVAGADDDGYQQAGQVPVVVPIAVQTEGTSPAGAGSKLTRLLGRLKETLTGLSARTFAATVVEAQEVHETPKLPVASSLLPQDAVRTLDAANVQIKLELQSQVSSGKSARSLPMMPTASSNTDWKQTFVASREVNSRSSLRVTVDSSVKPD